VKPFFARFVFWQHCADNTLTIFITIRLSFISDCSGKLLIVTFQQNGHFNYASIYLKSANDSTVSPRKIDCIKMLFFICCNRKVCLMSRFADGSLFVIDFSGLLHHANWHHSCCRLCRSRCGTS